MVKASTGSSLRSRSQPLSESQQQRLNGLLDQYLVSLDQHIPESADSICQQNPDVAEAFRTYLSTLEKLHGFAQGMRGAAALNAAANVEPGAENTPRTFHDFQLGDFKILHEIGRGGMGIVYEACQQSINRRVAIKVLPAASALNTRQIARFANEAQAAAKLQHPGIVSIYSVGSDRGIHYYAMQLIHGTPLDAWIESEQAKSDNANSNTQTPDWKRCVTWAIEAADALQCAHENGIVHRDIKLSNLIIDESERVWITDFGLARCHSNESLTCSGDILGTFRYMSPEQASGHSELIDHRTDIYALATTLFEMLTLQPAIEGENGPSLLQKITSESPQKIRSVRSDLPKDLGVVLQKAMATSKDDRYFNAQQFAEDLKAVIDDRPIAARPPSLSQRAFRYTRRHNRVVAASVVVAVAAFLGVVISVAAIARKSQQALTGEIQAQRYFNQARATVDHLGADVATQLAAIPGAEHVRQDLLRDTLAYYEEFVLQASDDPKSLSGLAHTHHRIGVLTSELHSPNRALPSFQKAAETYKQILTRSSHPDSVLRQQAAENLSIWGLTLMQSGKLDHARTVLANAASIQHSLITDDPDNTQLATQLALIHNHSGLLALQQGRSQEAQRCFDRSINHLRDQRSRSESAGIAFPQRAHRALAATLQNSSKAVLHSDPHQSIALLREAISLQLDLANRSSHRMRVTEDLAVMYNNLASAHSELDEADMAVEALDRAIALQRQIRLIAPDVSQFSRDLAVSLNNLAMIRQKQSRHNEAAKLIDEAITLQTPAGDVRDLSIQEERRLGAMLHNQSISMIASGNLPGAVASLQAAIRCQKRVLDDRPNHPEAIGVLGQHFVQLLKCQARLKRWKDMDATARDYLNAAEGFPQQLDELRNNLAEAGKMMPPDFRRRLPPLVASMEVSR
jgi:serine/threonine protein kinase